jgi:hypothetical protein
MAKKEKEHEAAWTVMVYLAGDNNLTTECMFALTEMRKVARNKDVHIIAQFDPSDPYLPAHRYQINLDSDSLYCDIIDRARYHKKRKEVYFENESRKATSLAELRRSAAKKAEKAKLDKACLTEAKADTVITDDTDTGSPITLYNFISFCMEKYPAKRYMVVLSGHAGGTERDYLLKDESSKGSLTFNEMKNVFKRILKDRKGRPIDIIGMDNCLMSMGEICYELRDAAEIVVGCESFSPTSGWPYRQILERVCKDFGCAELPDRRSVTVEIARAIVEEYVNYYATYWVAGLSVTQSALDVRKVRNLRAEVDQLAEAMEVELVAEATNNAEPRNGRPSSSFEDALLLAHWEAQSYNGEQFVDLFDFCDCLGKRLDPSSTIAKLCNRMKEFIKNEFVLRSCYCGAIYQYSYGVSLYFPWSRIAPSYWNLDFVKDAKGRGWGSFLKAYTRLTRRLPRGYQGGKNKTLDNGRNGELTGNEIIDHRMIDDRMIDDRMINDRMIDDRMGTARVHSMRNPPDVFLPDECIRDRQNALHSQWVLRFR